MAFFGKSVTTGLLCLTILAGCSSKKATAEGDREELMLSESSGAAVEDDKGEIILDSSEENNVEFLQPHFNVSHCHAPFKFSSDFPKELWSAPLDFESSKYAKMIAAPIVADGKAFCIDAGGIVYAFNKNTGERLWRTSTTVADKDGQIGGALAFDKGRLLVTSSFSEGLCLNAENGKILWRIKLPAACKGDGIAIHDGKAFIACSDSSLHAVDIGSGKILWSHSGMTADTTFIGSASPAAGDGMVFVAYPSGEVYALLEETGAVIWDSMMSKFSLTDASRAFSHPRACPVLKDGFVYFTTPNEQTVAFNAKTGKQIWKSDFGGLQTPVLSGNSIFVLSSGGMLACLNKDTGKKRWVRSIARNQNETSDWYGMIPIKNRFLLLDPKGYILAVSMLDGALEDVAATDDRDAGTSVNPIIADEIMYVLLNCGKLTAYK
ncbi:MAG: PQQ-binding-like beta-propeller repeat protein [Holosporaceae bacterium]|jgi:outer membrane protein assembly factor BamB|nr:PQQ-binding-like beta-propeller repeat protein [Holosporaceae bacterium]